MTNRFYKLWTQRFFDHSRETCCFPIGRERNLKFSDWSKTASLLSDMRKREKIPSFCPICWEISPELPQVFWLVENSEFDVGHEESVRKKQLLSYLLRNKPRVFLLVKNLQFWFCTSEILLGNASRKNVKQAGAELCQAQQSLSLDLDTNGLGLLTQSAVAGARSLAELQFRICWHKGLVWWMKCKLRLALVGYLLARS